ncbi:nitrogen fixation negative regulator NifL [Methylomonas paludis]|uniref:histidine kinase n=1 Tax=Methylomonas paludis TaxID=1173101 RepID=A0A975MNL8_9GAMM|nr:nitrogen fixation negative regulator NifL [Methylomonas paludis]QWF70644.1 nitrogen fixation negative regulator NifL [Methylomonas paludis]
MTKSTPEYLHSQITLETAKQLTSANTAESMVAVASTQKHTKLMSNLPFSLFVEAVEQAPVAISITDKKANILYINDAFTSVTGYKASEILGANESKLSDKSTPRQVYYDLWHTISRKQVWHGQLVNRKKMGQRYLADLTIAPMLDDRGAISHYIGMHRDVTQAHYAEQQVGNQKQLIESVINASPVAMAVLDENKKVVLDNQMYKMLISELDKSEPALFFLDALAQDLGNFWDIPDRKPGFTNHEIRVEGVGRRGTRWFSCSGNWFIESDTCADNFFVKQSNNYLLLSINDISQQRRQQENLHLQTLRTILAEEEHIRSIRETLLGAMHQIRQPLNQINAAIQIMAQRNDTQNKPLKDLLGQVQLMGAETLETLQRCVPEIPESAVVPVNLNQLLHEVMLLNSTKFLANGVVVDWLPNPVLPSILGSANKLRMMFKQLIDNAVNALNRPGGNRERLIKITTSSENGWVRVSIADTGPGIPLNQHSKVFEPFFTTHSMGGVKAGMGLVMVKEIANQHNAMIAINPDYKNGCCFELSFPVCPKKISTVNGHE